MKTVVVSKKGWVVIPAEIRKKLNIQPGDKMMVIQEGDTIQLIPVPDDPIEWGRGLLKDEGGPSLVEALLEERRRDREREEAEILRWIKKEPEHV
ncbi:MAG TPA: AbrB/MazE/SpoVT family DNA-binding domain-containing protein [Anaerolineae bacterium]|nr:AbrB/MazE/SpoVT family DNA-binding domain-containing protein [Anaerolineae bacterium]